MTLPRKSSRSIEVDAVRFRYTISRSGACGAGQFSLHLTVQSENGRGCILKVHGMLTRDLWLDFPEIQSSDKYLTMKPGQVAAVIRRARAGGWIPEQDGMPFILTITQADLQI